MAKFIKILQLVMTLMFISTGVFAGDPSQDKNPMSIYKDNYFIFGDKTDQVKFQVSAKFSLLYSIDLLYFGYTQISWWRVYSDADTFTESDYQPEAFLRMDNISYPSLKKINMEYIQFSPLYHSSDGIEGKTHRSIFTYYGQLQMSSGESYNFGFNFKGFGYWADDPNNRDINNYKRNYEADIFFRMRSSYRYLRHNFNGEADKGSARWVDNGEIHVEFTGNPFGRGSYELTARLRVLFIPAFRPQLYVQYFNGYGESMINYNVKDKVIRAGIVFSDIFSN